MNLLKQTMDYGLVLPLTLTMDDPRWQIRLLGLLSEFVWFMPVGVIWLPFAVLLLSGVVFEAYVLQHD